MLKLRNARVATRTSEFEGNILCAPAHEGKKKGDAQHLLTEEKRETKKFQFKASQLCLPDERRPGAIHHRQGCSLDRRYSVSSRFDPGGRTRKIDRAPCAPIPCPSTLSLYRRVANVFIMCGYSIPRRGPAHPPTSKAASVAGRAWSTLSKSRLSLA